MINCLLILIVLIASSGCTILGHLDELFLMKGFGEEQTAQKKMIKSIDEHYDALAKAVDEGRMNQYLTKNDIRKAFAEPLKIKTFEDKTEKWLYRHAIFKQAKDKVYLYFIGDKLVRFEKKDNSFAGGE